MYLLTWGSKRALSARLLYWSAGTCLATQGKETCRPQRTTPHFFPPASNAGSSSRGYHVGGGGSASWAAREGRTRHTEPQMAPQDQRRTGPTGEMGQLETQGDVQERDPHNPRLSTSQQPEESLMVKGQALELTSPGSKPWPCPSCTA